MAQIFDFQLSAKQYVDLALEKHRLGDSISSARYARKAIKTNKTYLPAYGVLSFLYADEHEFELANKTLFVGMNESHNWDDPNARRQLAHNYMQLDMLDVAMYYADNVDNDLYDALGHALDAQDEKGADLYLSYPRGEEYYDRLIARAFESAGRGDMEKALKILEEVSCVDSEKANQATLMLFTMKNDADGIIEFGEKMIEKGDDNSAIRCTLASAYLLKGRENEARQAVEPLLEEEKPDIETAFMLLPVVVNLNMHSQVVRLIDYAKKISSHNSMRLMLWFAQGLYNIGQPDEARKIMAGLRDFYGEDSPAEYYLNLFGQKPESVEYSLTLPMQGSTKNLEVVRDLLIMSEQDLEKFEKEHCSNCDNLEYYTHWAFAHGNKNMQNALIARFIFDSRLDRIVQSSLVSGELPYDVMSMLVYALAHLNGGVRPLEFNIVAQERFKHIRFFLPRAFNAMPHVLQSAVQLSFADIIFTDEDPNFYLEKLTALVNSIVDINIDGKLVYSSKQREKLGNIRSADTLVGVLLGKVYEDDEPREAVLARYGLNPRLYDKYYNIVFGDDND